MKKINSFEISENLYAVNVHKYNPKYVSGFEYTMDIMDLNYSDKKPLIKRMVIYGNNLDQAKRTLKGKIKRKKEYLKKYNK